MVAVNENDGAMSPSIRMLEDQVKQLEAEMEMAHRQFQDEEEEWERSAKDLEEENRSSLIEDMAMSEDAVASIQKQMKAEEGNVHVMIHETISPSEEAKAGIALKDWSAEEGARKRDHDVKKTSRSTKNDVRNLASMFERKLSNSHANLPRPPNAASKPIQLSPTPISSEKDKTFVTTNSERLRSPLASVVKNSTYRYREMVSDGKKHGDVTDGASLSIKEGKELFERAFSSPSTGSPVYSRSRFQAKSKAMVSSPTSQNDDKSNANEVIPEKEASADRFKEANATLSDQEQEGRSIVEKHSNSVAPSHSLRDVMSTSRKGNGSTTTNSIGLQSSSTSGVIVNGSDNQRQEIARRGKKRDGANDTASPSIREGRAPFERAFPPPGTSESSGNRFKVQAQPKAIMASPKKKATPDDQSEEANVTLPKQEEHRSVATPSANARDGDEPSLRDRISMIENSNPAKLSLPSPPVRRSKPVPVESVGHSPAPETARHIISPSIPNQSNGNEGGQGDAQQTETSNNAAMPPEEKLAVTPSMPFTPVQPKEVPALTLNEEARSASSMCSDDVIKQRKAALIQGLKRHLNEKIASCPGEVAAANHVGPCGIARSKDDMSEISTPIRPNTKITTTEGPRDEYDGENGLKMKDESLLADGLMQPSNLQQSDVSEVHFLAQPNNASKKNSDGLQIGNCRNSPTSYCTMLASQVEHGLEQGLFGEEIFQPGEEMLQPGEEILQPGEEILPPGTNRAGPSLPPAGKTAQRMNLPKKMSSFSSQLYRRIRKCVTSTSDKANTSAKRAQIFFHPYFSLMWNCFGALAIYVWLKISVLASIVLETLNDVSSLVLAYIRECVDDFLVMKSLAPKALKAVGSWAANVEKDAALCFASITASMFSDMYPTAPTGNVFIAILLLFFRINAKLVDESQYHSALLVVVVMLSICIDVDWISYKYFPIPLDEEALAYRIQQETSLMWILVWYSLLINCFLKVLCLNEILKSSLHGRNIRKLFWERGGKCFIPSRIPDDLSSAVRDKVITLSWIEITCSLLFFGYFFVIEFDGVSSSHFRDFPNQVLSLDLEGALLIKAASGFFVFLSLAHHIRVKDFFGLFGCNCICPAADYPNRDHGSRILSRMTRSFKCIVFVKVLDFSAGVILWISLVAVHKQVGFDAPKDVTTLLGMIFSSQVFTSIISPIQGAVVFWFVRLSTREQVATREQRPKPSSSTGTARRYALTENTPVSSRRRNRKHRFITSSTKRSNLNHSPSFASRDSLHLRTDFLDEDISTISGSNYDLKNPSNSQNLFEIRLTGAANTPLPRTSVKMNELDPHVTCSPRQFQAEWQGLRRGFTLFQECFNREISLSDCHKHLNTRRFFVVGSGVVGNESRLFIIAQRRVSTQANSASPSLRKQISRCLVEITFNSNSHEMKAEIRCHNEDETRFFLGALDLKELFREDS